MVATGVFLSTMDSSMINIALPYIMDSFSTTLVKVEWVVLIYLLTISVSLLIWGKLSDRYGKGVIYLIGMLVFSLGALCCYFSQYLFLLVVSRFIQGLGAAMMMSTGPAIIRLAVPPEQIGRWLGSLGIATSLGLMTGPLIGGFILHAYDWRTIFLLNVPISFTAFLFGWIFIAGTLPKYIKEDSRFDWFGAVLWCIVVSLTVVILNGHDVWKISQFLFLLFLLFGVTVFFLRWEFKRGDPLIPVILLRKKFYSVAMLSVTLSFAVLFFVLILMPFYFNYVLGLSFDKIGYMMMAVPVTLFVVSPLSGRLYDRMGSRYLTFMGMFVTGSAVIFLSAVTETSSLLDIGWRLSLLGCGQSIFLSPNTASVLSRVSLEDTGISAGMLATCRNLGMLLGVALVGMIFSYFFELLTDGQKLGGGYHIGLMPQFLQSFRYTFFVAAALAFSGAIISLRRR